MDFRDVYSVLNAMDNFEPVLKAELHAADAYFVSKKGGYDTLDLISQAEVLFPPDLPDKVPEAVRDIQGTLPGWYWDGGIIDYHLHLPYEKLDGLTLYPHFSDRIVPGWLDKFLAWRKARGSWLDTLVLLCPSKEFIKNLPNGKIPDRKDFNRHGNNWQAREMERKKSLSAARQLADEFHEIIEKNHWAALAKPLHSSLM